MSTKLANLKRCPFCGRLPFQPHNIIDGPRRKKMWEIKCRCYRVSVKHAKKKKAINDWNTRHVQTDILKKYPPVLPKTKPQIGQTLYSLNIGYAAIWNPVELTPVRVAKVGGTYFIVENEDGTKQRRHDSKSWDEKTEYSPTSRLYKSEQNYIDEKKSIEAIDKIEKTFSFYDICSNEITLKKLLEITKILDDCKIERQSRIENKAEKIESNYFGNLLRMFRSSKNKTQADFGKTLNVTRAYISLIELGKSAPLKIMQITKLTDDHGISDEQKQILIDASLEYFTYQGSHNDD